MPGVWLRGCGHHQPINICSEIHLERFSAREVEYRSMFGHAQRFTNFSDKIRRPFGMFFTVCSLRSARCVHVGCLGWSKKLHAEKWCWFVLVVCRDQCCSFPSWPNQISESSLIFTHVLLCSVCSWSFVFSGCHIISSVYRLRFYVRFLDYRLSTIAFPDIFKIRSR